MAYKDEYEVARLYTDGEFLRTLQQQFEGDVQLEFYMAPPVLSRVTRGPAAAQDAPGRLDDAGDEAAGAGRAGCAARALDIFGRTAERRLERELIDGYCRRIDSLLPSLSAERLKTAIDIAALPLSMRGFGHVKLANVALARAREAELLHRFDPQAYPRPAVSREAGQIRGIRVTTSA